MDLLGRDEIVINDGSIRGLIENKVVFVTGGAGKYRFRVIKADSKIQS